MPTVQHMCDLQRDPRAGEEQWHVYVQVLFEDSSRRQPRNSDHVRSAKNIVYVLERYLHQRLVSVLILHDVDVLGLHNWCHIVKQICMIRRSVIE